ncbi:MAG: hypothetical protein NC409_04130 [Clostridium sp.]|nr:hypothetical protein [Clostridium sp.]
MGVKAFNVAALSKVHLVNPKDVGYEDSIDIIRDELHRTRRSFVKIGWYLKHIKDEEMFKADGYADIFELALDKFNISQPTANRFMNICKEFSVGHDSPELDEKFVDFSVSQLFEMLPMEEEKRKQITSDMTVKQIREVKEDSRKKKEPDAGEIHGFRDVTVEDSEIPGQTSIEKDFPEYMPEEIQAPQEEPEDPAVKEQNTGKAAEPEDAGSDVIEGSYREISEASAISDFASIGGKINEETTQTQPEMPKLKNDEQRKAWLADYKAWGLWYYDEHIDVNYYKYDFPDGSRLIVAEYPQRERYYTDEQEDEYYYHLIMKGKKKYGSNRTYDEKYRYFSNSETSTIEFLKNLQKEAIGGHKK